MAIKRALPRRVRAERERNAKRPVSDQAYATRALVIGREIYRQGIATKNAAFETDSPGWDAWNARHYLHSRLVAQDDQQILGWAALSPVSTRRVYRGVAEVSVYVAESARGRGVGRALLLALIEQSEENAIWTLQAGIFPENAASIGLHESLGFRQVGRREKLGQLRGIWRDVILLERRSLKAGI